MRLIQVTSTQATAWIFRAAAWLTIGWIAGRHTILVLIAAALSTHVAALAIHACRRQPAVARALLVASVSVELVLFFALLFPGWRTIAIPIGAGVFMCHAVAYLFDVGAGAANPRRHLAALLYLVQLPVFPYGPLCRFHEFSEQLARTDVSMAGFSYGVRRMVTGLIKVYLIAGPLGDAAASIFHLRVTELSTDTAWLGAVCASLEVYYIVSGFSDVGIGLGKILGFRYQENFRRPYTADSVREFWRRWNVTLVTWLRDYLSLPIAGHDTPTAVLFLLTLVGFAVIGLWQHATLRVVPWAMYFAAWLAVESLGLGRALARLPRIARHVYVLLVVMFGWMILYATAPGPLLGYTESLIGFSVAPFGGSAAYLTWGFTTALVCGIVFAGPLVGNISRWRVSLDAATASLLMMLAATAVFLWQAVNPLRRTVLPDHTPRR